MGGAGRFIAVVAALNSWAGLVLQFVLIQLIVADMGGTPLHSAWRFLGYFTLLSNTILALVCTSAALRPDNRRGLNAPTAEMAVCVAMLLVGIVYTIILRPLWDPQGWQKIADAILHYLAPTLALLFWAVRRRGVLKWRDALASLIWPLTYTAYAMARGAVDGWYAYPFLDPSALGYLGVLRSVVVIGGGVLAVALGLVALDRATARLPKP